MKKLQSLILAMLNLLGMLAHLPAYAADPKVVEASAPKHYESQYFNVNLAKNWDLSKAGQTTVATEKAMMAGAGEEKFNEFKAKHQVKKINLFAAHSVLHPEMKIKGAVWSTGDLQNHLHTGNDFLRGVKLALTHFGKVKAEFNPNLPDIHFGNKQFSQLLVTVYLGNRKIYEHWYATLHKGRVLTFITDSASEEQNQSVEREVLQNVHFI